MPTLEQLPTGEFPVVNLDTTGAAASQAQVEALAETPAPAATDLPRRTRSTGSQIADKGAESRQPSPAYSEEKVEEEFAKAGFPDTAPYTPRHTTDYLAAKGETPRVAMQGEQPGGMVTSDAERAAIIRARRIKEGGVTNTVASPAAIKEWSGLGLPSSQREATGEPKFPPVPVRPETQASQARRGRVATFFRGLFKLDK